MKLISAYRYLSLFSLLALTVFSSSCVFESDRQAASGPYKNLSICHVNDSHSQLTQTVDVATKKNYGGASRLKSIFKGADANETLFLAAGDLVQGTLFYNFFHGQAEVEAFNAIGLDAMCLGNHEFDNGVDSLLAYFSPAKFPLLAANVNFKTNASLAAMVKPYVIVTKNALRIAIIGVDTTDLNTADPKLQNDIHVDDPETVLRQYAVELRSGVDLIIALTHTGYMQDLKMASVVEGVDIIIGGHSHTEVPVPVAVKNKSGVCMVAQTGASLKYSGDLKLKVCPKEYLAPGDPRYIYESGGLTYIGDEISPDPAVDAIVGKYDKQIGDNVKKVFASTANVLNGDTTANRKSETNLGDLFADAAMDLMNADLGVINGGNFRHSITGPDISIENIYNAAPYDNMVVAVEVSGAELIADLKMTAARYDGSWGGFLQLSKGMKVIYENHTLISASLNGVPIDKDKKYRVATSAYVASGGDGHSVFGTKTADQGSMIKMSDAVIDYIKSRPQPLNYVAEGRIVVNEALSGAFELLFMTGY